MSKTWYWWVVFGPFAPRDRTGTYPHPGEVLAEYRQRKQLTRSALTKLLGLKSVEMVRLMEKQCVGLDVLSRLRELCELLKIPPVLFGLDSEHSQPPEHGDWWTEAGYPAFAAGNDGYPRPGQVVKSYRERLLKKQVSGEKERWTQRGLGDALGISEEMVRQMENHDKALETLSRRQALVFILGIPPALMGLDGLPHLPAVDMLSRRTGLDPSVLIECQAIQSDLFTDYFTNHGQGMVQKATSWMTQLKDMAPLARGYQQREQVMTLQSHFHQFLLDVARERRDYDLVFHHADLAVALAQDTGNGELLAAALLRRAEARFEQENLTAATNDIDQALANADGACSQIKGLILLDAGKMHAHAAQSRTESTSALRLLDQAGSIVRAGHLEQDEHFMKFDIGMYHLKRALALLGLHHPEDGLRNSQYVREALDELELAEREVNPTMKRRVTLITIFRAQAYYKLGEFVDAAILASDALDMCDGIRSELNIARLTGLYGQLVASSYGNSPKVARLGVKLRGR